MLGALMISVLGAGMIGEALMSGPLRGGHKPEDLLFTTRRAHAQQLTAKYCVKAVDTRPAVEQADVLVVAVKPQDTHVTLEELSIAMTAHKLLVTVAPACRLHCSNTASATFRSSGPCRTPP